MRNGRVILAVCVANRRKSVNARPVLDGIFWTTGRDCHAVTGQKISESGSVPADGFGAGAGCARAADSNRVRRPAAAIRAGTGGRAFK